MPIHGRESAYLNRLVETMPRVRPKLAEPLFAERLSRLTRASDALGRSLMTDPEALDTLDDLDRREPVPTNGGELKAWYSRELLRIATRDVTGVDELSVTAAALSDAAIDVLRAAVGDEGDVAVVAMGKLGGGELNYSSDVDIMLSGDARPEVLRRVLDTARQCFRVDTALRPEGRNGALIRSVASYDNYWREWAQPWEFQALLKSHVVVGPSELADEWTKARDHNLWNKTFGLEEISSIRKMKLRSEQIVESAGQGEVKRGRGGIRDIEFVVQLLQLVHGRHDEAIRHRSTLGALQRLGDGGYIDDESVVILTDSYVFLRILEHRLQLVELAQTHTVPDSEPERTRIAHGMDLELAEFDRVLDEHRRRVRSVHERIYFRPLLESFAGRGSLADTAMEDRVKAFGFTDARRTRLAVGELTTGLARSSRLMSQMMPVLLDWLSQSPDPDVGLLGLRHLVSGFRTPSHIVTTFRDAPDVARRVCLLAGSSVTFTRQMIRHPELFDGLSRPGDASPDFVELLDRTLRWRHDRADRAAALGAFVELHNTTISAADVLSAIGDDEATRRRSDLADAVLGRCLGEIDDSHGVALIAMGRYGGAEIGAASDLDVVVVFDDAIDPGDAQRVASRLLRNVSHPSPAYRLYPLDYDLRPEGKDGPVARSITSCIEYYEKWSSPWEKQALVRARLAAGDADVGARFFEIVDDFVWHGAPNNDEVREMRRLKARMETERIPRTSDPRFHLKLGPGTLSDVEWTVQLLQLQNQIPGTRTSTALEALLVAGAIDAEDHRTLLDCWNFCQRTRNRLAIVSDSERDSLPGQAKQLTVLARSLDTTAGELREEFLRSTRRARPVVERLFYGA